MLSRLGEWATTWALATVFLAASCGGEECRCAEIHGKSATSGSEASAPTTGTVEAASHDAAPASNPYASQTQAAKTKDAKPATDQAQPSKADWKDLVQRGQRRFDKACGNCHPDGEEDLGPSIIGIRWSVPRMTKQIRNGSGKMKPISKKRLPESEMDPLMAYMSTFRAVKGINQP
jgi:mono/diheme cytochrome c family protein